MSLPGGSSQTVVIAVDASLRPSAQSAESAFRNSRDSAAQAMSVSGARQSRPNHDGAAPSRSAVVRELHRRGARAFVQLDAFDVSRRNVIEFEVVQSLPVQPELRRAVPPR